MVKAPDFKSQNVHFQWIITQHERSVATKTTLLVVHFIAFAHHTDTRKGNSFALAIDEGE